MFNFEISSVWITSISFERNIVQNYKILFKIHCVHIETDENTPVVRNASLGEVGQRYADN